MRKAATVLITFAVWSLLAGLHAYYSISACMVNVGCRDYEGIWILPLLGHMIYVFPIWIAAVMIVVLLELIFVPNRRPSVVSFGLR